MCSSPKLFAAYHVLHRLIVPRHPSCALSSLTTKRQTLQLETLAYFKLSLLLFLSTKKLFFFFLADFSFKTFSMIVKQPREISLTALPPSVDGVNLYRSGYCFSPGKHIGFAGEMIFPPHPLFSVPGRNIMDVCRVSLYGCSGRSRGLTCPSAAPTAPVVPGCNIFLPYSLYRKKMVEVKGLEPSTSCLQSRYSSH